MGATKVRQTAPLEEATSSRGVAALHHRHPLAGVGVIGAVGVVVVLLALTGCAVNQKQETAIYRKVLKQHVPGQAPAYVAGQSLSLMQALALANANDEQLDIQGEDYLQALIAKDRAVSRFLPTVSLAPSYMRQKPTHVAPGNPLIAQFVPSKALDVPIEAHLDVNPLGNLQKSNQAGASAQASKADLLALQSRVLLDVAKAYYQVLLSQAQVRVLEQSLNVQALRVADITSKQKAGVARPLDVSQSQAQQADTQGQLIEAHNDVRNGRAMLAFLIGVPSVTGNLADHFNVPAKLPKLSALMKIADAHRYDLKAAHRRIVAANSGLKAAWDQYFPAVTFNFAYFLHRESFPPDVDWTGTVGLNLPLFDAGKIHQDVRGAWSRLRQAHFAASHLIRQVRKEVIVAVNNLHNNAQRLAELKVEVAAARQAFNQADAAYSVGTATNLERLVAQNRLLAAQLKLATAQLRRKTLYLTLEQTLGRLNSKDIKQPVQAIALVVTAPATQP